MHARRLATACARVAFALALPVSAQMLLRVDVDDRGTDDRPAGFERLTLDDGGAGIAMKTFGSVTVDVDAVGFTFGDSDRHRTTPTGFDQAAVYRDFLFAPNDSATVGLDATLTGLIPNQLYSVAVWSFDQGSTGSRVSDWTVRDARGTTMAQANYTFNGSVLPTADGDNRFAFVALSDTDGTIVIRGRGDPATAGANPAVFLNGLQVAEVPQVLELALDFNARGQMGAAHTQPGFAEFTLAGSGDVGSTTRSYGAIDVTLTATSPGGNLGDRRRSEPTNSGGFTQELLLRDFVFATNAAGDEEMDVLVSGLSANTHHVVTLWSLDDLSPNARTSDWFANGVLVRDNYSFNGNDVPPAPGSNSVYSFSFLTRSDANGNILLTGQAQSGTQPAVFLNALTIQRVVPEPATVGLLAFGGLALVRRRRCAR